MEVLDTIKNLSILVTALTACYGINSWRRESNAKKKAETAEETLALFYEAEDAIRMIRYPGILNGEGVSRGTGPDENPMRKEARDAARFLIERCLSSKKLFNRIRSRRCRFKALFGRESVEPFDELHKLVRSLMASAKKLAEISAKDEIDIREEGKEGHGSRLERLESVFWEESADDDVNLRVKSIIRGMENICSSIMSPGPAVISSIKSYFNRMGDMIRKRLRTARKAGFGKTSLRRISIR